MDYVESQATASELKVENYLNKTFEKSRHGRVQRVTVQAINHRNTKLCEIGRKDSFTISTAEFLKFYRAV